MYKQTNKTSRILSTRGVWPWMWPLNLQPFQQPTIRPVGTFSDSNSAQAKPLKRVNSAAYLGGEFLQIFFGMGFFGVVLLEIKNMCQKKTMQRDIGYWGM